MNLVRGIGRLLLGGFFIVQGAKAVKEPAQFAPAAEPIAQRFVPLAQKTLPPEASAYVPEDPETLVRLNGALSVLGRFIAYESTVEALGVCSPVPGVRVVALLAMP